MKNSRLICAIVALGAAALLGSCNKDINYPSPSNRVEQSSGELRTITFCASAGIETKVVAGAGIVDTRVNNLQVLIFNSAGRLDAYGKANATSVSLTCTMGERTAYALANAPDCSDICTEAELLARQVALSDNDLASFVMVGKKTVDFTTSGAISIEVSRLMSRVVIRCINNMIESPALKALTLTLKEVYMLNVPEKTNYGQTMQGTARIDAPACKKFLHDTANEAIAADDCSITDRAFYVMPAASSSGKMLLVLKVDLGGEEMFYPMEIDDLPQGNLSYEITQISIKRPGSKSETDVVDTKAVSFSVTVKDWTTVPGTHDFVI